MNDTIIYGVALTPAIIGLVQVAKNLGMRGKFAPLLAVCFGVAGSLSQTVATEHMQAAAWIQATFVGIALGLASVGLYAGVKTVLPDIRVSAVPRTAGRTEGPAEPAAVPSGTTPPSEAGSGAKNDAQPR
ncbi:MAG: hypothetical protein ACR2JC_06430 [Chloroflexota bacterium]